MRITRMKTNHLTNPMGFDPRHATLSYTVEEARGLRQQAARFQLATKPSEDVLVLDTGLIDHEYDDAGRLMRGVDNAAWPLECQLDPRTRYWWRVFVRTDAGEEAWSEWTWFETGKAAGEEWAGKPITSPMGEDVHPVFTKRFTVDEACSGRLYIMGLGLYEVYLNGRKVGDEVLLPGFHAYDMWLQVMTLPLEIRAGENILEVWLGDGWYKGRFSSRTAPSPYQGAYALLAEMRIPGTDGAETVIGTDESWQVTVSPVVMDSIYDGETVDLTLSSGMPQAAVPADSIGMDKLLPRLSPGIRIQETLPMKVISTEPLILDAGQNLAGWVRFRCRQPRGNVIRLLYAEHVREGDVYRANLRTAKCTYTYISDGEEHLAEPKFTFFGFRYVKVEGWQGEVNPDDFEACAIYSDMERTGWVETSDPLVNRLFENAVWSQKGNFLDVPTDCPQRDERKGWTGDAQIFCDTALFNADVTAFFRKYLFDLALEQTKYDGQPPCVVPAALYYVAGTAVWGDAATVIPWQVYVHSGDAEVLRRQYDSMKAWVDYITRMTKADGSGHLWSGSAQYGDWLALDADNVHGGTDRTLIATAYYYLSAGILARSAAVLGKQQEAKAYAQLAGEIREDFIREYYTSSGRLAVDTQTAYVLVNYLGLMPDGAEDKMALALRRRMAEDGCKLQTGFVGTPWLLPALTAAGSNDMAYRLLLRREYPGWLYEVEQGATTIWERWNSIGPDGSMNKDGMNSLNHYSYGSVCAWMYRSMGGIQPAEDAAGFRRTVIRPQPDRAIESCRVSVMTPHGLCSMSWQWKDRQRISLTVTVPFGTTAEMHLPDGSEMIHLQSGVYSYDVDMPQEHPWSMLSNWRELVANPDTRAVLEKWFPRVVIGKVAFQKELYTLEQAAMSPFAEMNREKIRCMKEELERL